MKTILLVGAGKSATYLIDYLGKYGDENNWKLLVCDTDLSLVQAKIQHVKCALAISIDVRNDKKRRELISQADMVISMLPPGLHFPLAKDCVALSKNLLTASYINGEMRSLEKDIVKKGLLFLGEMGLDPGIDHMSAMKMINAINKQGGRITSFRSHCGGLVSPECDDNPWHYKITWNPANVVKAGSQGAIYRDNGKTIEIAYPEIFNDDQNIIHIPGLPALGWYANRNSLSYLHAYQLQQVKTFIRATLRYPSFCRGWNGLVKMDFTNTGDHEEIKECTTYLEWFNIKKEKFNSQQRKQDLQTKILFPKYCKLYHGKPVVLSAFLNRWCFSRLSVNQ